MSGAVVPIGDIQSQNFRGPEVTYQCILIDWTVAYGTSNNFVADHDKTLRSKSAFCLSVSKYIK